MGNACASCIDTMLHNRTSHKQKHYVPSREYRGSCTFCRLVHAPPSDKCRIIYENERLVVFPDIRPAAVQHLLVVPRDHIANTNSLEPWDKDLVQEMRELGEKLLREGCTKRGGPDVADLKFGYHVPPFRSVDHLHLHCFELPHKPPSKAIKYWLPCVWLSSDALMERLSKQQVVHTREELYGPHV